jgi:predicted nucleic acid-binding protein
MIVIDTSVLSHAFRRAGGGPHRAAEHLGQLILDDAELAVPGVALQELLSSTRTGEQHRRLDQKMRAFRLLLATRATHVHAARIATACRRGGITTTPVDCLIAAHTLEIDGFLFTVDDDFRHIAKHTALRLLE